MPRDLVEIKERYGARKGERESERERKDEGRVSPFIAQRTRFHIRM